MSACPESISSLTAVALREKMASLLGVVRVWDGFGVERSAASARMLGGTVRYPFSKALNELGQNGALTSEPRKRKPAQEAQ